MIALLTRILGRLPIGWLQLVHNPGRLAAATAGVAFAIVLVFVQLGLAGSLEETVVRPYRLFDADLLVVSATDSDGFGDGSHLPRSRMYAALGHPEITAGAPLYVGRASWQTEAGDTVALALYAVAPPHRNVFRADLEAQMEPLSMLDAALTDRRTRSLDMSRFEGASPHAPVPFELQGRQLQSVGAFSLGGDFTGDGGLLVSEQTFLRLLPGRVAGAPNHLLLRVKPGADRARVAAEVTTLLGEDAATVRTMERAMATAADVQLRDRPMGIIFGFGVMIGITVGIVIAYQVLATDVADHQSEYATFKAMGYPRRFFAGIVMEEALVLGVLGFIPGIVLTQLFYDALMRRANLPLFMTADRALMVFVGTLIACSVSGFLALRRVDAADPADLF